MITDKLTRSLGLQFMPGRNKTPFCVLEDELLSASDELLRETGQPHHVVRSHNELNIAKVASCVSKFFGSRPSDHYFRSVCLFVCLFVCAEFFSAVFDPISIKLGHYVICLGLVVSNRI